MQTEHYMANMSKPARAEGLDHGGVERVEPSPRDPETVAGLQASATCDEPAQASEITPNARFDQPLPNTPRPERLALHSESNAV